MRHPRRQKPLSRLAAMPGRLRNPLLVCVLALALAGCGGGDDGTIPPHDADNLLNQLDAIQDDVDGGDCEQAQAHAQEFIDGVNALPDDVDPEVAGELTKAATNLDQLTSDPAECASGASGITGAETTDTTETDTTEEPATVTEEEPEEPTTTEEEPTEEEPTEEEPADEPSPEPELPNGGGNQGGGNVEPQSPPTEGGGVEPPSGGVTPGGNGG
jgi:hypothetical protein